MELTFTKMQGCGNDYLYFSAFGCELPPFSEMAVLLSDRHFGVGGDGVIVLCPSSVADAQMRMFNEDGSEGKMCGNGIRCAAKFLYDQNIVRKPVLQIETLSGIKEVRLQFDGEQVIGASVDMGMPVFDPKKIPARLDGETVIDRPVEIDGSVVRVTCVSMGNPHCVVFVEDPMKLDLPQIGPKYENAPLFPDRVNTEFVRVIDETHLQMRVWERGSGETLACGTGACASVVAAVENGFCPKGKPITVSLLGGDLVIVYADDGIRMTGPAVNSFRGTLQW